MKAPLYLLPAALVTCFTAATEGRWARSHELSGWEMNHVAVGKAIACNIYVLVNSCTDIDSQTVPCSSKAQPDCSGNCVGCTNQNANSQTCYRLQTFGFTYINCGTHVNVVGGCGTLANGTTCRWISGDPNLPDGCYCRGTPTQTPCDQLSASATNACVPQPPK